MAQAILEIHNLITTYPDGTRAIRGVDLSVERGELVAVIGSSGAGKSTLMRNINRLVRPSSGTIRFLDYEMTRSRSPQLRKARRSIGMIFQHFNLVNRLSALTNVLHGRLGYISTLRGAVGYFTKHEVENALRILSRVGLHDEAFKRADELSGGQRQRVGLARAVCQTPELLLADEPIASLDPNASARVMQYLKDICTQDQITSIVSLHQVEYARNFATRMVGIREGRILFDAAPDQWDDDMISALYENGKEM